MILLCDEDVGTGIPHALADVGFNARALVKMGWGGKDDTEWLKIVGQNGWLVFSHNKKMLAVALEKRTILDYSVGIIFLTTGEENTANQLKMLLNRWSTLELLNSTTPRPFARINRANGHITEKYNYRGMWLSIP